MSDEQVTLPRQLVQDVLNIATDALGTHVAGQLEAALNPPPPSTLRIIDIAQCTLTTTNVGTIRTSRYAEFPVPYMERIAEQSDPMTVIERALISDALGTDSYIQIGAALELIRAALEGATQ